MKKFLSCLLAVALAAVLAVPMAGAYADVPVGSSLAGEVQKATEYGLMNGYDTERFGYSDPMTRAQFVTVLDRMLLSQSGTEMGTDYITSDMAIPDTISDVYRSAINHAARFDVLNRNEPFRPNDPITRGEMAEMLARALGLKGAARIAEKENSLPFTDISARKGYISVAYDIGMTKGTSATAFSPDATATRAQAAAMLVRIYEKLHQDIGFIHGFYAISSHSQLSLAGNMDAVSAGWSRMIWDGETALLSTTNANGNEFAVPTGYSEVAEQLDGKLNLMVFMEGDSLKAMLSSADGRSQAVDQILNEVTVDYKTIGRNPYSGVTIDFEGLRCAQKADFTAFLTELRTELDKRQSLYVCVSPVLTSGTYYDGYDYAAISALADKVILMAYDYGAQDMSAFVGTEYYKTAATAPVGEVYQSLRAVMQQADPSKVLLGFSVENTAWQIDREGRLVSGTPVHPSNETVAQRLTQSSTVLGWSQEYQQSYAIYETEDGTRYFLWYQDSKSIQSALNAAKLLSADGVSIWRLGNIPQYTTDRQTWDWSCLLA